MIVFVSIIVALISTSKFVLIGMKFVTAFLEDSDCFRMKKEQRNQTTKANNNVR